MDSKLDFNWVGRWWCAIVLCVSANTLADNSQTVAPYAALQEEIQWLTEETYVTTATRTLENVKKSGATVSVITGDELKEMGARNLMDALKRLPGFGVHRIRTGLPSIEVRGVKTEFSEKVLFLVNGHDINNNLVNGGALWTHGQFIVDDIERVEVVRGPGSALYGANAFVAVINIITKTAKDIEDPQVSVAVGNNDTRKVNIQNGGHWRHLQYAFNAHVFDTDGHREFVEQDFLGNSGKTTDWIRRYEFGFNMALFDFGLQGKFVKRNAGPYIGFGNALNDESVQEYKEYFLELSYVRRLSKSLKVNGKLYTDNFNSDNYWEVFPEGFESHFPDGYLGTSPAVLERIGGELQFEYLFNHHKVLLGLMAEHQSLFDIGFEANFNPTLAPSDPDSALGSFQDIMDRWPWIGRNDQDIRAAYLQDIWDLSDSLRMIIGARYDHYSDVGETFNPRGSLSWAFAEDYAVIATYGTAFRAPNFGELHNVNNPGITGDSNLEPEEIETFELALQGSPGKRSSYRLTGFYNKISELVITDGGVSTNKGELNVHGIESEYDTRFSDGSSLSLNYTYQYAEDAETGRRASDVPVHKANAAYNYRYSQYFNAYVALVYRGPIKRAQGDSRSELPSYTTVDFAFNWKSADKNMEITTSIYNLFDKKYDDPAPANTVPSDFPRGDQSLLVNLRYYL